MTQPNQYEDTTAKLVTPIELSLNISSNDIAWHNDIQLKARIRKSIEIATQYDNFTLDDALEILKEEVNWLERTIDHG